MGPGRIARVGRFGSYCMLGFDCWKGDRHHAITIALLLLVSFPNYAVKFPPCPGDCDTRVPYPSTGIVKNGYEQKRFRAGNCHD